MLRFAPWKVASIVGMSLIALLIVIPVALLMLLTQGQIVIPLGDVPEQEVRIDRKSTRLNSSH